MLLGIATVCTPVVSSLVLYFSRTAREIAYLLSIRDQANIPISILFLPFVVARVVIFVRVVVG